MVVRAGRMIAWSYTVLDESKWQLSAHTQWHKIAPLCVNDAITSLFARLKVDFEQIFRKVTAVLRFRTRGWMQPPRKRLALDRFWKKCYNILPMVSEISCSLVPHRRQRPHSISFRFCQGWRSVTLLCILSLALWIHNRRYMEGEQKWRYFVIFESHWQD